MRPFEIAMAMWSADPRGFDKIVLESGVHVIVWTGSPAVDLDDGFEVCEAYYPLGHREYPDGKFIVGRRRLDTKDRARARSIALSLSAERLAEAYAA